jgi:hypothetical protein
MEQLLNDAVGITDGLGGKIVGMLSALIVTIMTVVKVVRWAAKTTETQVSDLANLILLELNRPVDSVTLKDYPSTKGEVSTPEGVRIRKHWGTNPFFSFLEIFFKDQIVDKKLSKVERKIIRKHYFEAVARKIASIEAAKEREFQSKVTASLNVAVKSAGETNHRQLWDESLKQYVVKKV